MNPLNWSFRTAFATCALVVAGLLGYAYYAQFHLGLEPCPLCIFQRVAMIVLFVVVLVAALHAPRGGGRRVYGALAALAALAGAAIAGRHVWLQHLPPDQVPSCGPGLDYLLDTFPLSETLRKVFTGSGECAEVHWRFAGLSMPEWTLACFALFLAGALYYGFRRYRS
jgi:protein dithiol:quinone oxidoreductase